MQAEADSSHVPNGVPPQLRFEQVTFSGGGTRCFWHGGFLSIVGPAIHLRPKRIAAVSGGALSACAFISGTEQKLFDVMGGALAARGSNVSSWNEIAQDGFTPHQRMYHEIVSEVLDEAAVRKIADGPKLQVLLAHPPLPSQPKLSTIPMMLVYQLDLAIRSTPHVLSTSAVGGNDVLVDANEAARNGRLVDLVCNAAVIPPVFNVQHWNGRPVIDGGMASKAPMPDPDRGRTLILLTRRFRNLPREANHLYVQPSEAVPADKIDFTNKQKIADTWEAGIADGHAFLAAHGRSHDHVRAAEARGRTEEEALPGDADGGGISRS